MLRKIISIDEETCNGCEECLPSCPEGAIQIIGGKARLISDLFCDGLGACLGHCPEEAITIEEREAPPYDERRVMASIAQKGEAVILAHLEHLREHNEQTYLREAMAYLKDNNIPVPEQFQRPRVLPVAQVSGGCPGSQVVNLEPAAPRAGDGGGTRPSTLAQWPIQLHLISPMAPHFQGSDLLLAADCVSYTIGDFHKDHLKGRTLAIACPKLDNGQEVYLAKLRSLIDEAQIDKLTVMIMQVPCCSGLLQMAVKAREQSTRKVPVQYMVVGLKGEILQEGQV